MNTTQSWLFAVMEDQTNTNPSPNKDSERTSPRKRPPNWNWAEDAVDIWNFEVSFNILPYQRWFPFSWAEAFEEGWINITNHSVRPKPLPENYYTSNIQLNEHLNMIPLLSSSFQRVYLSYYFPRWKKTPTSYNNRKPDSLSGWS